MPDRDHQSIVWHAELLPEKHGKKLYITMSGGDELPDHVRREHIVNKIHSIRDYLDDLREKIHCTIDHHAMETDPNSVVVMGNLRDLEKMQVHFNEHTPKRQRATLQSVPDTGIRAQTPTTTTSERGGGFLRLVVSNDDVKRPSQNAR